MNEPNGHALYTNALTIVAPQLIGICVIDSLSPLMHRTIWIICNKF